jgi:hypothetical protein
MEIGDLQHMSGRLFNVAPSPNPFILSLEFGQTQVMFRRTPKIAKTDYWLCHVCPSARNNSAPTGRIFMKFDI